MLLQSKAENAPAPANPPSMGPVTGNEVRRRPKEANVYFDIRTYDKENGGVGFELYDKDDPTNEDSTFRSDSHMELRRMRRELNEAGK